MNLDIRHSFDPISKFMDVDDSRNLSVDLLFDIKFFLLYYLRYEA
jgi:hypothetical protein